MKLSVTLENFPMSLAPRFTDELLKYAECGVAFKAKGTATIYLDSTDIVKIQEVCIICDKYSIVEDSDVAERLDNC